MPLIQSGIKKKTKLIRRHLGVHPIIQFYLEKLNISKIIHSCIKQDSRLKLPLEKTLTVLIHNILTASMPMYEIADWSNTVDEESFGLSEGDVELINDDRVGHALNSFYEGKHKEVFFRVALRSIKVFNLDCRRVHQDTTSITLTGKYNSQEAFERITFGKNKDHRSDLKQFVLGMSVTADGCVPLAHKVYDGNQSDDTLHINNHQTIRKLLKTTDFIYVADSKLSTINNLEKISLCGGQFISVMPRTWKEDQEFKQQAMGGFIKWRHILSRKNNRLPSSKTDSYYLANGKYKAKNKYRLIWIKSSQKKEQDIETRERRIEKSLKALNDLLLKINKRDLKNKNNINKAVDKILKENRCTKLIEHNIEGQRVYKTVKKRSTGKKETTWGNYFRLTFDLDLGAVAEEAITDGIFPLITNVENKRPKEILEIYKFQAFLEKKHAQIKTWQRITPVLLKNTKRVVAYMHMHVLALTVASLIERQLRLSMKENSLGNLPIYPETRKCPYPTFYDLVRLFRNTEKFEMTDGDDVNYFPADLNKIQKNILKLLDVPPSLYQ